MDDEVPEHRDSHASSSHEASLVRIWVSTASILITLKTEIARSVRGQKITRAPCRRRHGEAVPRTGNFGDLITDKVLSDNFESRNNHRYAVVVQEPPNGSSVSVQN